MTTEEELTGGHYLYGSGGTDTGSGIVMDGVLTVPGNTYRTTFETGDGSPDNGFLFGAQTTSGWGNYTGYMLLINDSEDETQLQRWDTGSITKLDSAGEWPRNEQLTAEIDYRESSDRIQCTVYDSNDNAVVEVDSGDTTYGEGYPGFYHWRDDDFKVYSLHDADWEPTVALESETFDHAALDDNYKGAIGGFTITDNGTEHVLNGDGHADEDTLIHRQYREVSAGTTYRTEFTGTGGESNFGILFGGNGASEWSSYSGYSLMVRMDGNDDIRLRAHNNGTDTATDTATAPPGGERLTAEIDYRDSDSSTVAVTVYDESDAEVASLSIADSTYDAGSLGFHQWRPDGFGIYNFEAGSYDPGGDASKWNIFINHDDGTGEHEITGIAPFDRMTISRGDGDGEEVVFDRTTSSDGGKEPQAAPVEAEPEPEAEPSGGDPTFGPLDYDSAESLSDIYDLVEDDRSGGEAGLSGNMAGTVHETTEYHQIYGGESGGNAKSCNALIEFDERVGHLPQEVYAEVDLFVPDGFDMGQYDTWRFYWNMNRYSGNQYDSNDGHGWSNAVGMSDRNDPDGDYHFFTYRYDSSNSGSSGNFTVADGAVIDEGQWFTLGMYVKCNDPNKYNAVQKYYLDGELAIQHDGFLTSTDEDAFNHQWGPLAYYIDNGSSNTPAKNRTVWYDNQRFWVGDDIPSDVRE